MPFKKRKAKLNPQEKEVLQDVVKILKNPGPQTIKLEDSNPDEIIANLDQAIEELDREIQGICERTSMSREELKAYGEDSSNFSKEDWETISRVKDEINVFEKKNEERVHSIEEESSGKIDEKKKKTSRAKRRKKWLKG